MRNTGLGSPVSIGDDRRLPVEKQMRTVRITLGKGLMMKSNRLVKCILASLMFSLLVAAIVGCGSSSLTINQVKLSASDLGSGWTLSKEVKVSTANAAEGSVIPQLYKAGATRMINQIFVNGSEKLQVNLVQMDNSQDATTAVKLLNSVTGGVNTTGAKQNIAFEIIGSPANRAIAVKALNAK